MKKLNRILLIDDDMVTNFLNKNLIDTIAIAKEVLTFKNGQEAVDFFNSPELNNHLPIDLIFLDLNMPVMDGYQFMEHYHQFDDTKRTAKVVALIAENTEKPAEEIAKQLKVDSYFSKPITKEKITQLLEKYFNH